MDVQAGDDRTWWVGAVRTETLRTQVPRMGTGRLGTEEDRVQLLGALA